jgi:hypothetical protein
MGLGTSWLGEAPSDAWNSASPARTAQSLPGLLGVTSRRRKTTKAFGRPQSFVAGPATNEVQFMVKDFGCSNTL